jgi:general secretion pathway protein D
MLRNLLRDTPRKLLRDLSRSTYRSSSRNSPWSLPRSPGLAFALLLLAVSVPATLHASQDVAPTAAAPQQPCSDHNEKYPSCGIPNAERQKAETRYHQAEKLARHNQLDQALEKVQAAQQISPLDAIYATAEQAIRQKVAANQLRLGNLAMQQGDSTAALAAYRRALELDPDNSYAAQRLHDALPATPPPGAPSSSLASLEEVMGEVRLAPTPGTHSFEFRGPSSSAVEQFAKLFGISTVPDQDLTSRSVRITLDNVDWETGLQLLQKACKVLVIPLSEHQALIANDSEENRKNLTRMSLRTFYIQGGSTPQQFTELSTALRVLFDLRFLNANPAKGTIVIRAPQPTLDAVARFLQDLQDDQPTVMLEIQIFQVSTEFTKDIGTSVPNEFTVFNVSSEIQQLAKGGSFQQIIAALQASGQSVNAGTILAALLASSSSTNPLAMPFATFGGGWALSAVTIPSTSAAFSSTRSLARSVDQVLLRTEHGNAATMKVGERYPIVNTKFSATNATTSLLSSLGINASSALTAGTTIPTPQFSYEDIGMVLKTTPQVHGKLISLDYELTMRALGPTQANGLPLLTNRESKGSISTQDGEPVVIAGLVSKGEVASLNGIPLLSAIPVMGKFFTAETHDKTADELLIVVTPHLTSERASHGIYLPVPMNVPK